jgi:hypothetical protein
LCLHHVFVVSVTLTIRRALLRSVLVATVTVGFRPIAPLCSMFAFDACQTPTAELIVAAPLTTSFEQVSAQ